MSRRFLLAGLVAVLVGVSGGRAVTLALHTHTTADSSVFSTAASFFTTYYLHNNPTPPTGATSAQANLTINTSAPTATTLHNYDSNRDGDAGLMILKGGTGSGETDLTKYQNWRTANFASADTINGNVTVELWSAMKAFGTNKRGVVRVFLRKFNPTNSTYVEIANNTIDVANWSGGSNTWVKRTVTISVSNHTVEAGRRLELKIVVDANAGDDMWFAYDTTAYPSLITVP